MTLLTRSQTKAMDRKAGESLLAYEERLAAFIQEANDRAAAASKEHNRLEQEEEAKQQKAQQDRLRQEEADLQAAAEHRSRQRERLFTRETVIGDEAAHWVEMASANGPPKTEKGLLALAQVSHDLVATCALQQEEILHLQQTVGQMLARLQALEKQPAAVAAAEPSNLSTRVQVLEDDISNIKSVHQDFRTSQQATNLQLETQVQAAATVKPAAASSRRPPKLDNIPVFCDQSKTESIPWRQFTLRLDMHYVPNNDRHPCLYHRSGGACQAWLDNILTSHGVAVAREFVSQRYAENNAPLLYVRIQIGQAACNALLDCGATRNFISQSFMTRAGLGAQVRRKSHPTTVALADGKTKQLLDRYISAVPAYFAPHACEPVIFDVLDTDFDVILGMPWLSSADHMVNFHRRTLTIRDAAGAEVLCTIPPPRSSIRCQVVSAKSFRDTCRSEHVEEIGIAFLRTIPTTDSSSTDLSSDPRVTRLLDEFSDVFETPSDIVPDRPISHEIILEVGVMPPKGCIYRMSEEELTVLRAQLDDLLDRGWIRPSSSPYGAPVLFVRKKNKDLRLCIDYQRLDTQTIKNAGPLPRIDDLLERLGSAKYFSKLDLKSGYHQISIRPQDRYQTAFKTRYGHFEWVVMPFGLTNAPATFQAAMTTEFHAVLDRFVLVYLDDSLVYSQTLEEHLEHLRRVLETLRSARYKANRDKCEFVRQELKYFGHFVSPEGIRPLSDKIQAIQEWPEPKNVTDV
ncbi:hypothetical protein CBR_g55791 [Chara braunii]|uniref:Reverse transcriptase domain-containing protein n=1 Tax=Chara braunii TaxID=69332 RepID=A0A388MD78_CHABU|nr:hypothetical protein CBR_g55791 [Chara braunii]|eukprot:GBG92518.1 hypothetical protein CBR_g55791 [Chara braunii]